MMIYKTGLPWVDADMLCLKNYDFTKDKYLFTSEPDKKYVNQKNNAGIILLPKNHLSCLLE